MKDERWQDPVIRIKMAHLSYQEGLHATLIIGVFCFDTYYDNAGVRHWVIHTVYSTWI